MIAADGRLDAGAREGTWSGTPTPTYTRQWQRCDTSCADIAGATGASYALVAADAGQKLQVVVTAADSGAAPPRHLLPGQGRAPTRRRRRIGREPTAAPNTVISSVDHGRLDADGDGRGTWSGTPTPTYTRQWQRCDTSCADIAGATGASYALVAADAGQKLQVVVTAANSAGSASATSAQTATVADAPPADEAPTNSAPPVISGTTTVGSTLTVTDGTWSGTPTPTYTRQWQRCDTSCADIAGATGASYALVAADAGQKLQVVVTAANSAGSASATSLPRPPPSPTRRRRMRRRPTRRRQ